MSETIMYEKPAISGETMKRILAFRDDRNWKQFHNPKDLAISISLECFQWSGADTEVRAKKAAMTEELSDVVIYALLLADRLGIDLDAAVNAKMAKNAAKYPVKDCWGSSAKYDALKKKARSESR